MGVRDESEKKEPQTENDSGIYCGCLYPDYHICIDLAVQAQTKYMGKSRKSNEDCSDLKRFETL